MNAMLLCAGLGERMLPLTRSLPKPALPVLGRPIVVSNLERLAAAGCEKLVVNLHHRPAALRKAIEAASPSTRERVRLSAEPSILGTAGALRQASEHLRGTGTFLVHNGDFLSDVDLAEAVAHHRRAGLPATLVLAPARPGYSRIELHEGALVRSIAAGRGEHLFTGLQLLEDEVLDLIPPDGPSDVIRDVHVGLLAQRRLGAWVHRGFWWEFGEPRAFLEGCLRLFDMTPDERARVGLGGRVRLLDGRVIVEPSALVADEAQLTDSVVMPGARIGPGARLARVVVGPGTSVPADCEASDALICGEASGGMLVRSLATA